MKIKQPILDSDGKPIPGMFDLVTLELPQEKKLCECVHFGEKLKSPRVRCVTCAGTMLNTFACSIHGRCTPLKPASDIALCKTCPDFKGTTEMKWSYGVTTVPERRQDLLPQTLASLREGGFDSPRLFVDGHENYSTSYLMQMYESEFGLHTTCRSPRIRAFGNWLLALEELYIREPTAERYAIFQDDLITYKNLRQYLDRCKYPDKGYLNLYTFPSNQREQRGWYEGALLNSGPDKFQTGRGAVALVFNREAVQTLLMHQHMIERPTHAGEGHKRIDGGIVTAMNKAGWREFVHNPSLVQHTGKVSAIGNKPHPQSPSFRSEQFDALDLLAEL